MKYSSFYNAALFFEGPKEMTRLDIMAYVDPASNHGSKPQRLSDKNCKSCTMKQNTFGGISSKLFTKNSIYTQKTIF